MKKILFIALFSALMAGLGITAVYAGQCQPGCDCPTTTGPGPAPAANGEFNYRGVFGAMERHSNLMRLRDKAYTREIVKQSDNGIGMTCFDHAIALSSRLGNIFSDVIPNGPYPANQTRIWYSPAPTPNYLGAGMSADKPLLDAIGKVVSPVAQGHVDDFGDSLSASLGATSLNWFTGVINGLLATWLAPINGALATINGAFGTLNTLMGTLMTAMTLLGGIMPLITPGFVTALKAALVAVQNFINTTITGMQNAIRTAVQNLINNLINGAQTSQQAQSNATGTGECDRIQQLWGNQQPTTPYNFDSGANNRAIIGTGLETGTPYFNFADLMSMAPAGAGTMLTGELSLPANSSIITNAVNDLTAGGALGGPNATLPYWPTAPAPYAPGTLPAAILGAM